MVTPTNYSGTLFTLGRINREVSESDLNLIRSFIKDLNENVHLEVYFILGKYDILSIAKGNDFSFLRRKILELAKHMNYYDIINIPTVNTGIDFWQKEPLEVGGRTISAVVSIKKENETKGFDDIKMQMIKLNSANPEVSFRVYSTTATDNTIVFCQSNSLSRLIKFVKHLRSVFHASGSITYSGVNLDDIDSIESEPRSPEISQEDFENKIDIRIKIKQNLEENIVKEMESKIKLRGLKAISRIGGGYTSFNIHRVVRYPHNDRI